MMQLRNGRKRSVAITEELQRFETAMKAMENRSFDWNSVRLQIPSFDKQQPRAMSSFDIPVRHTPQDSLSSPDSEEESILKAVDEEEQPLLRLDQPNGGALQNTKASFCSGTANGPSISSMNGLRFTELSCHPRSSSDSGSG
ncbi:hypothetical protein KC19_1G051600 [Ceratodon purpureus]|uniref:Uncharacterized protein n=1 Tax=Ceratodon purpureus TaxID=3225 RepID=A0A8T0J4J7_CERPU|nr:hypothetical protein KC19_1G051600 [Ceratodon purpureus]